MTPHHEITSAMVCAYLRAKWEGEWRDATKNLLDLSRQTGVDYANLRKIVKKGTVWNITLPTINKFARFMGISTTKFFEEVEKFSKK